MVRFVYRALRRDEAGHERREPSVKRPNPNVAMHNALGRNIASQYLHCPASPFVALCYTEAFTNEYDDGSDPSRRVVVIDLESIYPNGWATDLPVR